MVDGEGPVEGLISGAQLEVLERALTELLALKNRYGRGFRTIAVEETLPLPGVTGAFGSVDLVLANKTTVLVVDWKFGSGVPVKALYEDEINGDQLNPQLAFYTAAARHRHPKLFKDRTIVCAIIQPRLDPPMSFTETNHLELDDFLFAFQEAYVEALGRDPHRERGSWCRFAPCKATCSLWVGPVLDLALIDPVKAALRESVTPATDYGAYLSRALHLAALAEGWADEIRKQAHSYLEGGGGVPAWKLVPKRATRKWLNEDEAVATLLAGGADVDDVLGDRPVLSVAQMEKSLKKLGMEVPSELYHAVSSGTTIAPDGDPRPNASHGEVAAELRKALSAL
jgi:hypothetical protein